MPKQNEPRNFVAKYFDPEPVQWGLPLLFVVFNKNKNSSSLA